MRTFVLRWFATSLAVLAASYVIPGIVLSDVGAGIIAALLLGLVNALLLTLVAYLVDGFFVTSFWAALIGTIFISIVSGIINSLIKPRRARS